MYVSVYPVSAMSWIECPVANAEECAENTHPSRPHDHGRVAANEHRNHNLHIVDSEAHISCNVGRVGWSCTCSTPECQDRRDT